MSLMASYSSTDIRTGRASERSQTAGPNSLQLGKPQTRRHFFGRGIVSPHF